MFVKAVFGLEADMTSEEKNIWMYAVVAACSLGVYLAIILGRAQGVPLREVAYVAPMLWTIGSAIVASILGHIAVAIAWPEDCGKKDQRDREIHRFGETIGMSFVVIGGVAGLALSMAEVDHFWIANAIYLGFVLSALLGSVAKIVAYRRGFQSC
jgi:hypothetical protein